MWWQTILAFLVVFAMYGISGMYRADKPWHHLFDKPEWTQIGDVSGIVWFVVSAMAAAGAALVFRETAGFGTLSAKWLELFALNYVCHQGYGLISFRLGNRTLAFMSSLVLTVTTWMLVMLTKPYTIIGAWLLLPYFLWSIFATFLSWGAMQRNTEDYGGF
jgi:benzodiazapine receptor